MSITENSIIYDLYPNNETKRKIILEKIKLLVLGGLLIFGSLYILLGDIYWRKTKISTLELSLIIFVLFFPILWAIIAFIGVFEYNRLKILEKGIISPERSIIQMLLRQQNFIPFTEIDEIHPNKKLNLPYVTIKFRKGNNKIILKEDIYDFDLFLNILENKTKIIYDRDSPL